METPNYHLEALINEKGNISDFEGPLNLLLILLKKNKIQIRDLRVSDILDQYISFVEKIKAADLDIASEFVQMASYLLYLKTKMMLDSGSPQDELDELMLSLERLEAKSGFENIKDVLPEFLTMYEYGSRYYTRLPEYIPDSGEPKEEIIESKDLLLSVLNILSRSAFIPVRESTLETAIPPRLMFSVREKCRSLISLLKSSPASMRNLYSLCSSRSEVVATFISVLELCSAGNIRITEQEDDYSIEYISGDTVEIADGMYE